jgi:RsiW-degrading membrane proteinase PrsW (M82 family)
MMTRDNVLYLVIGALAVAVAVLGYQLYEAKKEPAGLHINLGEKGLSIQGK